MYLQQTIVFEVYLNNTNIFIKLNSDTGSPAHLLLLYLQDQLSEKAVSLFGHLSVIVFGYKSGLVRS